MKNKNKLSVRPLHRYAKPNYPSWQDPNPLGQPYAKPYPFTQKALNWLAASGFCGLLLLQPDSEGQAASNYEKTDMVKADTLENPFPFKMTGLPYHAVMFGTGQPMRLSAVDAKTVIDSVFRAEGFHLEKTIMPAGEGFVEVDGFDAEQNIGYVWIGYNRMGHDLVVHWSDYEWDEETDKRKKKSKKQQSRFPDRLYEESGFSIEKMHQDYAGHKRPTKDKSAFVIKLESMMAEGLPNSDENYRWMLYEYLVKERVADGVRYKQRPRNLHDWLKDIVEMQLENEKKKLLDLAMDLPSARRLKTEWMADAFICASEKEEGYKECFQRLNFLHFAYYQLLRPEPEKAELVKEAIIEGEENWMPAARLASQLLDALRLSKVEALALEADADRGKDAIALISQEDRRWTYHTTRANLKKSKQRKRERLKKRNPEMDSLQLEEQLGKMKTWSYGGVKEDVLKELEKQVKQYIQWAKQQQGY